MSLNLDNASKWEKDAQLTCHEYKMNVESLFEVGMCSISQLVMC